MVYGLTHMPNVQVLICTREFELHSVNGYQPPSQYDAKKNKMFLMTFIDKRGHK